MHRLVASASACLLVLHMVLGCCWHHLAHAAQPTIAMAVPTEDSDDCCCAERHTEPEGSSDPEHGPSPCQHEQCMFTAPGFARSSVANEFGPALTLEAALPPSASADPSNTTLHWLGEEAHFRAPSVPLHLLYGTLLI